MISPTRTSAATCVLLTAFLGAGAAVSQAQNPPPDHPAVTVKGQTYTPRSILSRNMGTPEDQTTAFPPHKIIGNIYYVGTRTLSSFLIVTPQGNILIDSTYERNVPNDREVGHRSRVQVLRRQDPARQPRARRSSGRRRAGQGADRRAGGGDGRGRAGAPGDEARRQGAPDRQDRARRRVGDARRRDARRTSDGRPHARLHDVDDEGAGGRQSLRRGVQLQSARAGAADARDCRRDEPLVQTRAHAAVRRAGGRPSQPSTTCRRNTRSCRRAVRTRSSIPPRARSKRTSRKRCSGRSWPSSRLVPSRRAPL